MKAIYRATGQVAPEALLIVLGVALAYFIGVEAVHGVKFVAHKTKCGVMRVVGKHCDPLAPATQQVP